MPLWLVIVLGTVGVFACSGLGVWVGYQPWHLPVLKGLWICLGVVVVISALQIFAWHTQDSYGQPYLMWSLLPIVLLLRGIYAGCKRHR